jgi:peptide/nickel transport system permease protein
MLAESERPAAVLPVRPVRQGEIGYWRRVWRRLKADRTGLIMAAVLIVETVIALAAPLIARNVTGYDVDAQDLRNTLSGPSAAHWLGTDHLGRDTLTRLVYGAQVSLTVASLTVVIQISLGATLGLIAGFYGRWLDTLVMRFVDILIAIPAIFFYILLSTLFRPSPVGLSIVIASIAWVGVSRLVRAEVLTTMQQDFVMAARSIGAKDGRLMIRHVLPAVVPTLVVAASLSAGQFILVEAALSFLGLGIQPPTPSWGNMITIAQQFYQRGIFLAVFPGITIFVTVLAVNLLGNALRDAMDPSVN